MTQRNAMGDVLTEADYRQAAKIAERLPTCPTCGEAYSREPTPRASLCSSGFHCCRDCAWVDGRRVRICDYHGDAERAEGCAIS